MVSFFLLLFIYFVSLLRSADINLLDKSGRSPLHNVILGRHVKIVEMLLGAGADTSRLGTLKNRWQCLRRSQSP